MCPCPLESTVTMRETKETWLLYQTILNISYQIPNLDKLRK